MDYVAIVGIITCASAVQVYNGGVGSILRASHFSGIKPWDINTKRAASLDGALRQWTKLVPFPDDPISPGIRESLPAQVQKAYDKHITLAGIPIHSDFSDPLETTKSLVESNQTKKQRVAAFYQESAVIEYLSERAA